MTVDSWDWAGANRKGQVVHKDEKEHFEEWVKKDLLVTPFIRMCNKTFEGAEYTHVVGSGST